MSMPNNISNISQYNDRMSKSITDKLFFTKKVYDFDQIIDFGCADGSVLRELHESINNVELIGYDISTTMLNIAKEKNPIAKYFDKWEDIKIKPESLLNLSSVFHEIYAYSTIDEIRNFWRLLFNSNFKYIVIRDMFVSEETLTQTYSKDEEKVRSLSDKKTLGSFEHRNGSIKVLRNFIHYLLKYSYVDNWERENNENYLPLFYEDLITIIPDWYTITFRDNFTLPFLKDKVKKDFDVDLKEKTHMKLILKRKQMLLTSPA